AGLVHHLRVFTNFALEVALEASQPVAYGAHRVDAVAQHKTHWLKALVDDQPELLAGEVRSEGSPSIARFNIHSIAWITHCALFPFMILREKEYQRLLAYGIDEVVSTVFPLVITHMASKNLVRKNVGSAG